MPHGKSARNSVDYAHRGADGHQRAKLHAGAHLDEHGGANQHASADEHADPWTRHALGDADLALGDRPQRASVQYADKHRDRGQYGDAHLDADKYLDSDHAGWPDRTCRRGADADARVDC